MYYTSYGEKLLEEIILLLYTNFIKVSW